VQDNGIGIGPELLPAVFDLFTQGQRTPDRAQGGLGLGLALVKKLVELHDGAVEAHSGGVGQGSTFTVRLPLLRAVDSAGTDTTATGSATDATAARAPSQAVRTG
jgi:signal transduction histidine kinase